MNLDKETKKAWRDAEKRVLAAVKKRMETLSKDEKFMKKMDQELKRELCLTTNTNKVSGKKGKLSTHTAA